jgi:phospholipid transport system transporter-binding protein
MNTPSLTKVADNEFNVSGELNMQTVPAISRIANGQLSGLTGEVSIDLSAVSRADSAGLALLIDWLRIAKRHQYKLAFRNLPNQLLQIAAVSELQDILPIDR